MRFICQRDYPDMPYRTCTDTPEDEYGQHTTVSSSACGPCCAIMAADRLLTDYQFDVEDAIQLSYDTGANHERGTDYAIYAPAFAEKFGLSYRPSDDLEEVKACLRNGGVAVALVKNREGYVSVFTRKEHFVTLISVDEKDIFTVLDPNQYDGKFEEEGRAGRVTVDGHFIYCTGELLTEETGGRPATRYHLFQRKKK